MERILYAIKLKRDRAKDYEDVHINAWPELLKTIKDCGFKSEYIFRFKDYSLVFMEAEDINKSFKLFLETDVAKRFGKVVTPMVEEYPDFEAEGKLKGLKKIFDLNDQLKEIE